MEPVPAPKLATVQVDIVKLNDAAARQLLATQVDLRKGEIKKVSVVVPLIQSPGTYLVAKLPDNAMNAFIQKVISLPEAQRDAFVFNWFMANRRAIRAGYAQSQSGAKSFDFSLAPFEMKAQPRVAEAERRPIAPKPALEEKPKLLPPPQAPKPAPVQEIPPRLVERPKPAPPREVPVEKPKPAPRETVVEKPKPAPPREVPAEKPKPIQPPPLAPVQEKPRPAAVQEKPAPPREVPAEKPKQAPPPPQEKPVTVQKPRFELPEEQITVQAAAPAKKAPKEQLAMVTPPSRTETKPPGEVPTGDWWKPPEAKAQPQTKFVPPPLPPLLTLTQDVREQGEIRKRYTIDVPVIVKKRTDYGTELVSKDAPFSWPSGKAFFRFNFVVSEQPADAARTATMSGLSSRIASEMRKALAPYLAAVRPDERTLIHTRIQKFAADFVQQMRKESKSVGAYVTD